MTLETRIREHLAAKAGTIAADPPPLPATPARAPALRWRPAWAVAAALVVALAVGAAAWLFRAAEQPEPAAPDLEELTPMLEGSLLDWSQVGTVEPGLLVGTMVARGDVVVFGAPIEADGSAFPLRMWRGAPGDPLAPVGIDPDAFGPLDVVRRVVWDGRRFHAFGGRYNAGPVRSVGSLVEALAWTSPDGRSWERHRLLDPATGTPHVARAAVVVDAAASERGVVVAAVVSDSVDWESYLADRLGGGYEPGSLSGVSYDAAAGLFRLFDADNRPLLEVSRAEVGYDPTVADFETVVLASADGRAYTRVDAISPDRGVGAFTVQAGGEGFLVMDAGGVTEPKVWFSADGAAWEAVDGTVDGMALEAIPAAPWRGLLLGAVSGPASRTVVASPDAGTWLPISPPLEGPGGRPLPTEGIVGGGAGIFVHGYEVRRGTGPEEVIVRKGGYRLFSYPQQRRLVVTPADSTEAVLVASFDERGPGGLPAGFEEGPGGAVRAVDPATGGVLVELTPAEWAELAVEAEPETALARAWFSPDGERWGFEDLAAAFGGPGLVHAAAAGDDAVVLLFQADPPPNVTEPLPGVPLQVWVGSPG